MCGRFVEFSNIEQLKLYFPIDKAFCKVTANYNVAPTQEILAVFRQEDMNVLEKFHWGLVPHWAKDISTRYKMINARMETIASKPSFRNAFKKRRCLIPADGFYVVVVFGIYIIACRLFYTRICMKFGWIMITMNQNI
jgi:putative SOS response-associated peptidase YedK